MATPLTTHARVRMQQRGIPAAVLEDLLDYGRAMHDHRGATVLYFDRRARSALRQAGRRLDAYAVVGGDGEIRTVGHRFKRLWRSS
jgi:exonuclease III